MEELKMWLAIRTDLDMPAGKLAVQAGHGFCTAILKCADSTRVQKYMRESQPKIAVKVDNESDLTKVYDLCNNAGISCSYIVDEGRTVFSEPTPTVVGIGPCYKSDLPPFVKRLRLYDR